MLQINGNTFDLAGQTLTQYLSTTTYQPARIAIERNGEIVPKRKYDTTILQDDDVIEVVSFVGGG